jgi:hypothetical protein
MFNYFVTCLQNSQYNNIKEKYNGNLITLLMMICLSANTTYCEVGIMMRCFTIKRSIRLYMFCLKLPYLMHVLMYFFFIVHLHFQLFAYFFFQLSRNIYLMLQNMCWHCEQSSIK